MSYTKDTPTKGTGKKITTVIVILICFAGSFIPFKIKDETESKSLIKRILKK